MGRPEHWADQESVWVRTPYGVDVTRHFGQPIPAGDGLPAAYIEIDLGPDGTDAKVTALKLESDEGITAKQLRQLAQRWGPAIVRTLVGRHYATWAAPSEGGPLGGQRALGAANAAVGNGDRRRRARLSDDDLRETAAIYLDDEHHKPTGCRQIECRDTMPKPARERIAVHYGISVYGVDTRLTRLRKLGILTETTRGKKSSGK